MDSESIQQFESKMNEYLNNSEFISFEHILLEYLSLGGHSENFSHYKAIGLLYYLSISNYDQYYTLLQSVGMDSLKTELIQFVLQVEGHIYRCEIEKIDSLIQSNKGPIQKILLVLLENQRKHQEDLLKENIDLSATNILANKEELQDIDDCLFVAKNFLDS